jgi:hypothetical protein
VVISAALDATLGQIGISAAGTVSGGTTQQPGDVPWWWAEYVKRHQDEHDALSLKARRVTGKAPPPAHGWIGSIPSGGFRSAADWEAVAKGADDRGGGWPDRRPKLCLRRRHALGGSDLQFDTAFVGDVAQPVPPNPAASGVSPIGLWRKRLDRGKRAVFHCIAVEAGWREWW